MFNQIEEVVISEIDDSSKRLSYIIHPFAIFGQSKGPISNSPTATSMGEDDPYNRSSPTCPVRNALKRRWSILTAQRK